MSKIVACYVFASVVILQCLHGECKQRTIPSFIKKCHINRDTLTHCLRENMETIRPHLKKGIPQMRIPSLEPLLLPMISIKIGDFTLNSTDLKIFDALNYQVKSFEVDPKDHTMKLTMFYPFLRFAADYSVDGKILLLTLSGNGKSDVNATDVTTRVQMKGGIKKRNGMSYMDYTDNTLDLDVTKADVHFGDLFKGNKELTELTNRIINDNIQEFVKEFNPYLQETAGSFIFTVVRNVFNTFPMEELFIF